MSNDKKREEKDTRGGSTEPGPVLYPTDHRPRESRPQGED